MPERKKTINRLKEVSVPGGSRQKITGRNALIKRLFGFLCGRAAPAGEPLFLCTNQGLIISTSDTASGSGAEDLCGLTVPLETLRGWPEPPLIRPLKTGGGLAATNNQEGYIFVVFAGEEGLTSAAPDLDRLAGELEELLRIFDGSEKHAEYLLSCLDSVENSVAIYDKDAHLLFANDNFCKNLYIENKDAVIGMHVNDVMKHAGVKVYSTENDSSRLKMLDVLKNGNVAGLSVSMLELLPYHNFGETKYAQMGRQYTLSEIKAPTQEHMNLLAQAALDAIGARETKVHVMPSM